MIPLTLREQLGRDEGTRLKPYLDCCGKPWRECVCKRKGNLTIGTGRNLDAKGISMAENDMLLANDERDHTAEVVARIPWSYQLDPIRFEAVVNLAFNCGIERLLTFKKMLAALEAQQWGVASKELLDSKYIEQVGLRAERLARQLLTGERQ